MSSARSSKKSSSRKSPPRSTQQPLSALEPGAVVEPGVVYKPLRFWGWAVASFLVAGLIVGLALGFANPALTQKVNTLGQPSGEPDYWKVVGGALVAGVVALVIYVLVVLGGKRSTQ